MYYIDGGARWRHLASTTEQSVRSGDPSLHQNTLSTSLLILLLLQLATTPKSNQSY